MAGLKAVKTALYLYPLAASIICTSALAQDSAPQGPTPVPATPVGSQSQSAPLAKFDSLIRTITVSADGSYRDVEHAELESSNPAVIAQLAQFPLSYDEVSQTIEITDAYTLKPNGSKEMVGPNAILDRSAPTNNLTFSSTKQKVIVFPDVQPGDRIVYDATIMGKSQIPGQFTDNWVMVPAVVIDKEAITVTAPKSLQIQIEAQKVSIQKKEDADTVTYSVSFSNATAVSDDTNPIGRFDRSARFSASTFKSYDDFAVAYGAIALPKAKVTPDIQVRADGIVAGTSDKREQAKKLYDWIAGHIRYVAINLGTGGLVPHDASSVLADGYGDCKDQAVLYAALLKAEGIDADLALVHSGNVYTVSKVPTVGSFDHLITYLPSLGLYADTTTAGIVPFGFLPLEEYGKPVVLVGARGGALKQIPVPEAKDASFTYNLTAKIDEAGHDDSTSSWEATGAFLEPLRVVGKIIQIDTQGKFASNMFNARGTPRAQGGFASPPDVTTNPYRITASYKTPGAQLAFTQNRDFVIPDSLRITALTSNVFFGPIFDDRYKSANAMPCHSGRGIDDETLDFGATRHLSRLPNDKKISTDHFTYTSHWSADGNKVHVHRELEARFNQAVCTNPVKDEALTALQSIRSDLASQISLTQPDAAAPQ